MKEFMINERIRDLQKELISEIQKQLSVKIVHSMLMFRLEDNKCVIANFGDFEMELR